MRRLFSYVVEHDLGFSPNPFGGIVGIVDLVECLKWHPSKWKFRGSWGWVLENPRRLPFRRCKGAVGFFKIKARSLKLRD